MPCLVCCVIELQLPRGVVYQPLPSLLYVRRRVVGVVGEVEVHLSFCCLCFLKQKFFPAGWAPSDVFFCTSDGLREDGFDLIQIVSAVQDSSHEEVYLPVHIFLFSTELMDS